MSESVIRKTLIWGDAVSLAVLDTTELVNAAISHHHLSAVAAAALGRALTATAYLCSWLKDPSSSLSVTIRGGGAGGKICTAGDGALGLRGFAEHPQAELPPRADGKLDVGGFVGRNGTLSVVRDDGEGIPFVGTCALVSGEIAEDLSAYFLTSEQRPTAVALGVRVQGGRCVGAGGVFFQPLPGAGDELLRRTEEEIAKYGNISAQIRERGAAEIVASYGHGEVSSRPIAFRCHCSRERAAGLIRSMGREEAFALLKERGVVSVYCHYCNTDYSFDGAALGALFGDDV